jgi:hypothetical protein
VVIPKGFPKSVERVGSRVYGFPCFPHSVISMVCFGAESELEVAEIPAFQQSLSKRITPRRASDSVLALGFNSLPCGTVRSGWRCAIDSPISFTVLFHDCIGDRNCGGEESEVAWKVNVIVAVAAANRAGLHTCSPRPERDLGTC